MSKSIVINIDIERPEIFKNYRPIAFRPVTMEDNYFLDTFGSKVLTVGKHFSAVPRLILEKVERDEKKPGYKD